MADGQRLVWDDFPHHMNLGGCRMVVARGVAHGFRFDFCHRGGGKVFYCTSVIRVILSFVISLLRMSFPLGIFLYSRMPLKTAMKKNVLSAKFHPVNSGPIKRIR